MKKLLLFFFYLAFYHFSFSQPIVQWQKSYGGSQDDGANCIRQTSDGGYIVAGWSFSNDVDVTGHHDSVQVCDYWIIKLDSVGGLQWEKSLGGGLSDLARSVKQTSDGGYIIAGNASSDNGDITNSHGGSDYWIIKLDASGAVQWEKSYGGFSIDIAYDVEQTSDGGYALGGWTFSNDGDVSGNHDTSTSGSPTEDYWVLKLDAGGVIQWQKCFGGTASDQAYSIHQTSDGGYILGGRSNSNDGDVTGNHGDYDLWFVKLDNAGTLQWQKSFGGSAMERLFSIQQTSDGGYIGAGNTYSNNGDVTVNLGIQDYWLVKLDGNGNLMWQKSYGGSNVDFSFSVFETTDAGYVVSGWTVSNDSNVSGNHGFVDYWLMKTDSSGNLLWQKCLGGSSDEVAFCGQPTTDGGMVVCGESRSNDGDATLNYGAFDFWVVKLSSILTGVENGKEDNYTVTIYPNPFSDQITIAGIKPTASPIRLTLTDVLGKEIFRQSLTSANTKIETDDLAAGVYILKLIGTDQEYTRKMVKP